MRSDLNVRRPQDTARILQSRRFADSLPPAPSLHLPAIIALG